MHHALDALFTPIARLALGRGVLFGDAVDRLRRAYFTAGSAAAQTDSALSVLTGLQRRDIARMRETADLPSPRKANSLARLVAVWQTDPAYVGRDLPRRGAGSFEDLAQSLRKDVHPRTLLDALIGAGTVRITQDDCVELVQASYQPQAGSDDQIDYLAASGGDFLTASVDNVLGQGQPHFERAVHYNGLSAQAVEELRSQFAARQMEVLTDLNALAAQLQANAPGPLRFRAGGYFYHEEDGE